jgi:lysophospholipase L1-like esterase
MRHSPALFVLLAAFLVSPGLRASPATTPGHREGEGWWKNRHAQKKELAAKGGVDLVFIGDSITQGWEGKGKAAWEKHFAPRKALNLGYSGDRTEHVLWRLDNGELPDALQPKAFVVMIGTNNTGHRMDKPEDIAAGVEGIVKKLTTARPQAKVLLLAIFPRGEKPEDAKRKNNDAANERLAKLAGGQVQFLDISASFLESDGMLPKSIMPDLLHLNEEGYRRWAGALEAPVAAALGEKP